jgi:hypothetical protein
MRMILLHKCEELLARDQRDLPWGLYEATKELQILKWAAIRNPSLLSPGSKVLPGPTQHDY